MLRIQNHLNKEESSETKFSRDKFRDKKGIIQIEEGKGGIAIRYVCIMA